ncbi:MAG: glycoside hydrolase family 97 N-terminal domain-containing protein, partial [Chitinophagaceae bacterium]
MKKIFSGFFLSFLVLSASADQIIKVSSPDGAIQVNLVHSTGGNLFYNINYKGKTVMAQSGLGMKLKKPETTLLSFDLLGVDSSINDDTWHPVWGEVKSIRNYYKQLVLKLADRSGSGIQMEIIFRVFNEGVGFRYSFPRQSKLNHF